MTSSNQAKAQHWLCVLSVKDKKFNTVLLYGARTSQLSTRLQQGCMHEKGCTHHTQADLQEEGA